MAPKRNADDTDDVDRDALAICRRLSLEPYHFTLEELVVAAANDVGCDDIAVNRHDFEGGDIYGLCISDGRHIAILGRHDLLLPQYEWVVWHELVHVLRGDVRRGEFVHVCRRDPTVLTPAERYTDALGHALLKLCNRSSRRDRHNLDAFFRSMG